MVPILKASNPFKNLLKKQTLFFRKTHLQTHTFLTWFWDSKYLFFPRAFHIHPDPTPRTASVEPLPQKHWVLTSTEYGRGRVLRLPGELHSSIPECSTAHCWPMPGTSMEVVDVPRGNGEVSPEVG